MFIIPTIPHLRTLRLTMAYRELPEHESQFGKWSALQKWKSDPNPNRFSGFAPRNKYYVNGQLVHEEKPGLCAVSTSPFPEKRVPRKGFRAVSADDPDYARLCEEQGLEHLISGANSPVLPNGVHSSPTNAAPNPSHQAANGLAALPAINHSNTIINGNGHHPMSPSSEPGAAQPRPLLTSSQPTPLVNGIHRSIGGGAD